MYVYMDPGNYEGHFAAFLSVCTSHAKPFQSYVVMYDVVFTINSATIQPPFPQTRLAELAQQLCLSGTQLHIHVARILVHLGSRTPMS